MSWQDKGLCSNKPELNHLFYSTDSTEKAQAKGLCFSGCPIQATCLTYGVRTRQQGIWGGYDLTEERFLFLAGVSATVDDLYSRADKLIRLGRRDSRKTDTSQQTHRPVLLPEVPISFRQAM